MKYVNYTIIGVLVWLATEYLSIVIGEPIRPGTNEIGIVVTAIAILVGVTVTCTLIIVDTIKKLKS